MMPQFVIGTDTVQLRLPPSAIARIELADASRQVNGEIRVRLGAAIVGLCWPPGRGRPRARYEGDLAEFGGAVGDELLERGATRQQIIDAGAACIDELFEHGLPAAVNPKAEANPS